MIPSFETTLTPPDETLRTTSLRREFEASHQVIEHYYGSSLAIGIALVVDDAHPERQKLEFALGPEVHLDQPVEELLFRAYALYRQVHLTFESGRDRALCLHMVYGVIAGLFKELDRAAATHSREVSRIAYLEAALTRAESYFQRAAQRRAQLRYLAGMTGGLGVIAAVGALLSLGLSTLPDVHDQSALFVATLIAGGTGAFMSVLYGMTSGNLRLHTLFANAESGLGPLVAAGALRPLLGALSGTVVYVLLQAGLVPLKVPDGAAGTYFFLALAIVAGFSERWARGVLAGTEERVKSTGKVAG
jgi:AcrR family transcriptional regulator